MAWKSIDEYVRFMVPRIGYSATAKALNMHSEELSRRWPGLVSRSSEYVARELSTNATAVRRRKHRARVRELHVCERCGEMYERHSNNSKYCPKCRPIAQHIKKVEWERRKRESERIKAANATEVS